MNLNYKFIESVIIDLSKVRPVFHSEDDFKFALAWALKAKENRVDVHLERKMATFEKEKRSVREYIDLYLLDEGEPVGIELKYYTSELKCHYGNDTFTLTTHGAQDQRAYDSLKDIQRLEQYIKASNIVKGFTVWLTNSKVYWEGGSGSRTVYDAFKISEEAVISGVRNWGPEASESTKRGRTEALSFLNTYKIKWRDYSNLEKLPDCHPKKNSLFRFALKEIPPPEIIA